MRIFLASLVLGTVAFTGQAMAWNETQPATNDVGMWAYPSKENFCPAGLQPISMGGVICCGTPNRTGYQSHAARAHKPRASTHSPVVVYEKGQ